MADILIPCPSRRNVWLAVLPAISCLLTLAVGLLNVSLLMDTPAPFPAAPLATLYGQFSRILSQRAPLAP